MIMRRFTIEGNGASPPNKPSKSTLEEGGQEPPKLSLVERLLLANQYQILEILCPDEKTRYSEYQEALICGYRLHYADLVGHFQEEQPIEFYNEIVDILVMHRMLLASFDEFKDPSDITREQLAFSGFDEHDEAGHLLYVRYFLRHDGGRFAELEHDSDYESDSPMLETYRRMLIAWRATGKRYELLTKEELQRIITSRESN